ncbi:MAG: glycine cleavage system aminomethyltransferase GcvT, partial [Chloroflexota bacterium]
MIDSSDMGIVRVSGWRAQPCLNETCTSDIAALEVGQGTHSFMLDKDGRVIDDVTVWRLERDERGRDSYLVLINPENFDRVVSWLRGISDGYVLFDDQDVWRKVQGPAKVEVLSGAGDESQMVAIAVRGPEARELLCQVVSVDLPERPSNRGLLFGCVAARAGRDARGPTSDRGLLFDCVAATYGDNALWVTHEGHTFADAVYGIIGPLAGIRAVWDELEQAGARPLNASAARRAVREAAGLPPSWPLGEDADVRDGTLYAERFSEMFAMTKPYFVGQSTLPRPSVPTEKRTFTWVEPSDVPLKRTPLYEEHKKLGAKLVPFAGWEMPVWYTSVGEEHRAVRETAGLFDVTHMGTLEISGTNAADFLDLVSVNYARWITAGESQYGGLLDTEGHILDDIWIYRRAWDSFFVVVNASNFDKDYAWLNAVNRNEVIIDRDRPWVGVLHPATLSNLKSLAAGIDRRVDIALQGPKSLEILLACTDDLIIQSKLTRLQRTRFFEGTLGGIDLFIARTGYTGEDIAYELYVHPDEAVALWRMLLERGAAYGIKSCGLASRDSTRIEAGLPLYGHELAGPLGINQSEAGFEGYVKYHKPFFVGRVPYKAGHDVSTRRIVRFQVSQSGARALRGGEHGEPVVSKRGKMIGTVTSCTLVGDRQIGLALVDERYTEPETEFYVYPQVPKAVSKAPQDFEIGDTTATPVRAVVLPR